MKINLEDAFKPNTGKVLLKMITESSEYVPGIIRVNLKSEPYQQVVSVPEGCTFVQPGDLVLTREMGYQVFKFQGEEYCLVFIHDIEAKISPEVAKEISKLAKPQPAEDVN